MLISKSVEIVLSYVNLKHYEELGYKIPRMINKRNKLCFIVGSKITVPVSDLNNGSNALVDIICDGCGETIQRSWDIYSKYVHADGVYYCKKCAFKLYAHKNAMETKLANSKSFGQWCIENDRQDILDRWDYDLNECKPTEVISGSNKKYYFKCSRGIHESELKNIKNFISGHEGSITCNACNSIAQWGIDNLSENFLEKYWSDKNITDPWKVPCHTDLEIWIKCQEKEYHEDYGVVCAGFTSKGYRCPCCSRNSGKVHPLDSLGYLFPEVFDVWSDKNTTSPFEYSYGSKKEVWWKCPNGKHEDYYRQINDSRYHGFRCAKCGYSKGEERIEQYFITNEIDNEPQQSFDGLIGLGGGLLSYDFYLSQYNLLVEYQGEYHDGTANNQTPEEFVKQQEHDRLKKEYSLLNNIELLEIWYWDFDNIESILDKQLNNIPIQEAI